MKISIKQFFWIFVKKDCNKELLKIDNLLKLTQITLKNQTFLPNLINSNISTKVKSHANSVEHKTLNLRDVGSSLTLRDRQDLF